MDKPQSAAAAAAAAAADHMDPLDPQGSARASARVWPRRMRQLNSLLRVRLVEPSLTLLLYFSMENLCCLVQPTLVEVSLIPPFNNPSPAPSTPSTSLSFCLVLPALSDLILWISQPVPRAGIR